MNKIFLIFGILFFLVFAPSVTAILSFSCLPSTVGDGGTITCEADLESGNSEKNKAYNLTFYNDTLQTIAITGCSFAGTTENAQSPNNVIESCTIPSDWGSSSTAVANFTLTSLLLNENFVFNISAITSSSLIVNDFSFETPVLLGKLTGVRWTVTKADTGKAVMGAQCSGDILQLVGGNFEPIAGTTTGISGQVSKFGGHALTSFTPTAEILNEGTQYTVEVRCDCRPQDECFDEDGANLTATGDPSRNLLGIGTTSFTTSTWMTVNTITDKTSYVEDEFIHMCANVTSNVGDNEGRKELDISYDIRCEEPDLLNRSFLRDLIFFHKEVRGINTNTTENQCTRFQYTEILSVIRGATSCKASTIVSVKDNLDSRLISYETISPQFNLTANEWHPSTVDWIKEKQGQYHAIVNTTGTSPFTLSIDVIVNPKLVGDASQITDRIKSYTIQFINGSAIPYSAVLETHDTISFGRHSAFEIQDVAMFSNDTFIINITLDNFEDRTATALEGIENKTGTFKFDIACPGLADAGTNMECTITAQVEDSQTVQKEVDFTCYIKKDGLLYSTLNFNQMVTQTPVTLTKEFLVPESFGASETAIVQCEAGYYNLGSRIDIFSDSFSTHKSNLALYLRILLGFVALAGMLISMSGIMSYLNEDFENQHPWKIVSLFLTTLLSIILIIVIIGQVTGIIT